MIKHRVTGENKYKPIKKAQKAEEREGIKDKGPGCGA